MVAVNATARTLPTGTHRIEIAVPYLGSVNVWLLEGDPLTLVDTGPANAESLATLESALAEHGRSLESIELVLLTHHHLDHSGLAGAIAERSGAAIAATTETAAWGSSYHEYAALEATFGRRLLAEHGVPGDVIEASEPFWAHIVRNSAPFDVTDVLSDGDSVRAGSRTLRVVERPGHSVTDTLFVDETDGVAIVGDHLLQEITAGAEVVPLDPHQDVRRRALAQYLEALRATAAMDFSVLLPGHGPEIRDHGVLIADRLAFHEHRLGLIEASVVDGCRTAFEVARRVWDDETAETQAVLAVWEVIGHLDVLAEGGRVVETIDEHGNHFFGPGEPDALTSAQPILQRKE